MNNKKMKRTFLMLLAAFMMVGTSCGKNRNVTEEVAPEKEQTTQTPKAVLKKIDANLTGKAVFNAIAGNYMGQVVVLDFWATWCGPCRMAMKQIDTIKDELVKKGVVFVYVTGETSPQADFDAMYKGIAGDHYRLTDAQWKDVLTQFGVQGIPYYMVLKKDGSTAYNHMGYPGNDELKMQVEIALSK